MKREYVINILEGHIERRKKLLGEIELYDGSILENLFDNNMLGIDVSKILRNKLAESLKTSSWFSKLEKEILYYAIIEVFSKHSFTIELKKEESENEN